MFVAIRIQLLEDLAEPLDLLPLDQSVALVLRVHLLHLALQLLVLLPLLRLLSLLYRFVIVIEHHSKLRPRTRP